MSMLSQFGPLDLLFGGGLNQFLVLFIIFFVITIGITIIDKLFLADAIPDFIAGSFGIATTVSFFLWIGRNFVTNLLATPTGTAILIGGGFIIASVIFVVATNRRARRLQLANLERVGQVVKLK